MTGVRRSRENKLASHRSEDTDPCTDPYTTILSSSFEKGCSMPREKKKNTINI